MSRASHTCLCSIPLRIARRFAVAGMVLIVFTSWTRAASASCGDYLLHHGKMVSDQRMTDHATFVAIGQPDGRGIPAGSEKVTRPTLPGGSPAGGCAGPNCSRQPTPFGSPPVIPAWQLKLLEPAVLQSVLEVGASLSRARTLPVSERGARYLPSSVFRPPEA